MADAPSRPRSPNYGGRAGHAIFHALIRAAGVRPAYGLVASIIPYYLLCRPSSHAAMRPYLARRFPGARGARRWALMARHVFCLGRCLVDQAAVGLLGVDRLTVEYPQARELYDLAQSGRGLVLVTSHFGAWQTAMATMESLDRPVSFLLDSEPHTVGRRFYELAKQEGRFRIVPPRGFLGGMVEMTQALERGEVVAIMGDRAWGGPTRKASFLGEAASLPASPYRLAAATGAEAVAFFAIRESAMRVRIEHERLTTPADDATLGADGGREARIDTMMARYARALEHRVGRHPFQWFNFFDFWKAPSDNSVTP